MTQAAELPRRMILSLSLDPLGYGSRRSAAADPARTLSAGAWSALAVLAEGAGLDLLLAGYAPWPAEFGPAALPLDPLSIVSFLTARTREIGLAAVVPSAGWAPFNVARAFSALDNLSRGRSGWFAVPGEPVAQDPGRARFAEHLETTFALWDSWEEGAMVFDKAAAVFTDREKVHRIAHAGPHFIVDGPLNSPRPVQGRPLIIQSAPADTAALLGQADLLIARPDALESALELQAQLQGLEGRPPKLLADLVFTLDPHAAGPPPSDGLGFAGGPAELAQLMAIWFACGACDGFNLLPVHPEADVAAFARGVVPRLRETGMVAASSGTLRRRLGLPPAASSGRERVLAEA